MEINIFNQKVCCCGECNYYNENPHTRGCNLNKTIPIGFATNNIYANCPFLQRVTRENIESLGFKFKLENNGEIFILVTDVSTWFLYFNKNIIYLCKNSTDNYILKNIVIDSFEHLKFVLSLTELKDLLTWK